MEDETSRCCSRCNKTDSLQKCARCKRAWYCSRVCQREDYSEHKKTCCFLIPAENGIDSASGPLETLQTMPSPPTMASTLPTASCTAALRVFNTAELHLAIFAALPVTAAVVAQRVCRARYLLVTRDPALQARLFFSPGLRRLVIAASKGEGDFYPAVQPRNQSQRDHAEMSRGRSWGNGGKHYVDDDVCGETIKTARTLDEEGTPVILNPFLTLVWPQLPTNMTFAPYTAYGKKASFSIKTASWRRMQLTSPPMTALDMSVWITKPSGQGNQMRLSTGEATSGVTMGDMANLLETIPKRFERHWMMIDGQMWWLRSKDAVVLPESKEPEIDTPGFRGVYVNPSNGIPFPGGF